MARRKNGFTLLELLTVVAVIAILAAIAIPQYTGYRIRANDSAALSDLRNLYGAMEATVTDTQSYPALATTLSGQVSIGSAYYSTSSRVAISLRSSQTGFAATACHQSGGHEYGTGGGQEYTGASGAILRRATATTGCTPSTVESASTLPGSGWN